MIHYPRDRTANLVRYRVVFKLRAAIFSEMQPTHKLHATVPRVAGLTSSYIYSQECMNRSIRHPRTSIANAQSYACFCHCTVILPSYQINH